MSPYWKWYLEVVELMRLLVPHVERCPALPERFGRYLRGQDSVFKHLMTNSGVVDVQAPWLLTDNRPAAASRLSLVVVSFEWSCIWRRPFIAAALRSVCSAHAIWSLSLEPHLRRVWINSVVNNLSPAEQLKKPHVNQWKLNLTPFQESFSSMTGWKITCILVVGFSSVQILQTSFSCTITFSFQCLSVVVLLLFSSKLCSLGMSSRMWAGCFDVWRAADHS